MNASSATPVDRSDSSGPAYVSWRRSGVLRGLLYQLVVVLVFALGAVIVATNTQENLQRLGVQSGLTFLTQPAGFEINQKLIAFDAGYTIARAMTVATINTLLLCVVSILGASVVGLCVGTARLSKSAAMRWLAGAYVEVFRNVPVLLQLFLWYFVVLRVLPPVTRSIDWFGMIHLNNHGLFLPAPLATGEMTVGMIALLMLGVVMSGMVVARRLTRVVRDRTGRYFPAVIVWAAWVAACMAAARMFGVGRVEWAAPVATRFGLEGGYALMPEFLALFIGLALYNASYVAEITRSALQALPKGQAEAAQALGLTRLRSLRLVLLPQALRLIVPPLASVYQNVLKSSSLGAAIAYPELTSVLIGSVNNIVGQPVAIIGITLVVYLTLSMVVAGLMHWYEYRVARWSGKP